MCLQILFPLSNHITDLLRNMSRRAPFRSLLNDLWTDTLWVYDRSRPCCLMTTASISITPNDTIHNTGRWLGIRHRHIIHAPRILVNLGKSPYVHYNTILCWTFREESWLKLVTLWIGNYTCLSELMTVSSPCNRWRCDPALLIWTTQIVIILTSTPNG